MAANRSQQFADPSARHVVRPLLVRTAGAGVFNTKVIQQFMLAASLFDCLAVLSPESENDETLAPIKKYANFKTVYLSKCIKAGETPVAGQMDDQVRRC